MFTERALRKLEEVTGGDDTGHWEEDVTIEELAEVCTILGFVLRKTEDGWEITEPNQTNGSGTLRCGYLIALLHEVEVLEEGSRIVCTPTLKQFVPGDSGLIPIIQELHIHDLFTDESGRSIVDRISALIAQRRSAEPKEFVLPKGVILVPHGEGIYDLG